MSMGPSLQQDNPELSRFDRARYQIKKTTEEYFKDPIHYLAFGFLAFTMLGLGFGAKFSWQYYAILAMLLGVKLYQLFTENKDTKSKNNG